MSSTEAKSSEVGAGGGVGVGGAASLEPPLAAMIPPNAPSPTTPSAIVVPEMPPDGSAVGGCCWADTPTPPVSPASKSDDLEPTVEPKSEELWLLDESSASASSGCVS